MLPLVLALPTLHGVLGGGVFAVGTYNCYPGDGVGGCFGSLLYIELPLSIRVLRGGMLCVFLGVG